MGKQHLKTYLFRQS